jgi:6-phosphogluconolactonase (cycloisomerase 2 family)
MTPTPLCGRSIRSALTFLSLLLGAASIASAQTPPVVLYVPNFNNSTLSEFLVASSGALTAQPTKPTNRNAIEIAVAPNRKFMYVGENGAIDLFTIATDGTATPAPAATITGNVDGLGVDTTGSYLYVLDSSLQQLETYSINQTNGQLTMVTAATITFPSTYVLKGLTIDKNNNLFIGVVNNGSGSGWIQAYKNASSGALVANGTYGAGTGSGLGPSRLITNPAGTMLFAADYFDAGISQFTISGTGTLSLVALPLSTGGGTLPLGLAISPNGSFLLVTNNASVGGVFVYTIGSGASLAAVAGSPFAGGVSNTGVTVDPNGVNVFVSSFGDNSVIRFAMNTSTGVLSSPVVTSGFAGPEFLLSGFLPSVAVTTVPTLPAWGLLLLAMLLAASGVLMYRRAYRKA